MRRGDVIYAVFYTGGGGGQQQERSILCLSEKPDPGPRTCLKKNETKKTRVFRPQWLLSLVGKEATFLEPGKRRDTTQGLEGASLSGEEPTQFQNRTPTRTRERVGAGRPVWASGRWYVCVYRREAKSDSGTRNMAQQRPSRQPRQHGNKTTRQQDNDTTRQLRQQDNQGNNRHNRTIKATI